MELRSLVLAALGAVLRRWSVVVLFSFMCAALLLPGVVLAQSLQVLLANNGQSFSAKAGDIIGARGSSAYLGATLAAVRISADGTYTCNQALFASGGDPWAAGFSGTSAFACFRYTSVEAMAAPDLSAESGLEVGIFSALVILLGMHGFTTGRAWF